MTSIHQYKVLIILIVFILSCSKNSNKSTNISNSNLTNHTTTKCSTLFAKNFSIQSFDNFKIIHVFNPWQGANEIKYTYLLKCKNSRLHDTLLGIKSISIPIKRVICLSATHIALLDFIDETKSIIGISGSNLIYNSEVCNKLKQNTIVDVGYEQNLNYEKIVSLHPDVIFVYGIGVESISYINKLYELGLTVVFIAEYLENTPLGKAEWVKFVAAFFNKEEVACTKFLNIQNEYNQLRMLTQSLSNRPKVLTGLPWKNVWYVPGGNSCLSTLISHAGGNFIFKNNNSFESLPLSIEAVFSNAQQADIWINTGNANSIKNIYAVDERLAMLKVVKHQQLYNYIAAVNTNNGNDYWENGITHPNLILKDLISIFHPSLIPNHKLVFYKKLPLK